MPNAPPLPVNTWLNAVALIEISLEVASALLLWRIQLDRLTLGEDVMFWDRPLYPIAMPPVLPLYATGTIPVPILFSSTRSERVTLIQLKTSKTASLKNLLNQHNLFHMKYCHCQCVQ